MHRLSCRLSVGALLLGVPAAQAQVTASATDSLASVASRWLFGGRLGAAVSFYRSNDNLSNGSNSHLGPAVSVLGGYYIRPLRVWLVAEPGYEQRRLPESSNNYSYLTLPLYVRTGLPANRMHVLLGGGLAGRLGPAPVQPAYNLIAFQTRDGFVLLGLESDYLHRHRRAAALSVWARYGISATYSTYNYAPSGNRYQDGEVKQVLLGVAIAPYWYR
ncbi:hypothetical protein J0X19_10625 [Hymenobacter sp. BT186]|uniref:PorT family protein n=1 Tax=Hymenobacter telluris TaxID=2816474 RepID=A0A939EXF9_9BACT|nr:hypothetical protein [Hymenobacter telluris]MBO0358400.1 hypothetical protein [Hymenobacter telluris]MBW3374426.1 hypothetical protein [Hymenobacter norwichensis]